MLDRAVRILDEEGGPHGDIATRTAFGIRVLPFRDPNNIQTINLLRSAEASIAIVDTCGPKPTS